MHINRLSMRWEMKMSFRYFSVHEFLQQVAAEMQQPAQQKNISLELNAHQSPVDALGDRERLKQVMVNLIDNAIKYNQPNGHVAISFHQTDGVVTISVTDTGVGIRNVAVGLIV